MRYQTSVIVPCFNAAASIRETLESVSRQSLSDTDLIVVDDGSSDGTGEIVRNEFPFAQLIRTPNQGVSRARNLGTSVASGSFIQYLDADDLLAEGKIATQVDMLEKCNADVAYGDWQKLEPSENGFTPGEIVARAMSGDPELELFGTFWCPPAAYLFRRSIVEKVGGWNEALAVIQDARFALDCALHGGTFVYAPGIVASYRVHLTSSLSRRDSSAFNRDVYQNAREVEAWWQTHGGITDARRRSLLSTIGYVARSTFERDAQVFEAAVADLKRLDPGYVPEGPRHFRAVSTIVGYRNAEKTAALYRRVKGLLSSAK